MPPQYRLACRDESIDHRRVVALRPAVDRSERRPAERGAEVDRVTTVDRHAPAAEDRLDHLDITRPTRGVEPGASIDTTGGFVKAEAEHEARRVPTTIENGLRQARAIS